MNRSKTCPFCQQPSEAACEHLALAAHGRDFVRLCVQACQGQAVWDQLCSQTRDRLRRSGEWSPDKEDFTWLETAFCDQFLKPVSWFGSMDYEWRGGPQPGKSGFCVLLWSRNPQRLWWDLRDQIEQRLNEPQLRAPTPEFNPLDFVATPRHVLQTGTLTGLVPGR